jgi:hypothetical protein
VAAIDPIPQLGNGGTFESLVVFVKTNP